MVEWIVRRAQGDRARVGTLAGMVCIVANVALCAAKGAIGVVSGSVSIVADAMNNLSDASSNIVSVLGFKLASIALSPRRCMRPRRIPRTMFLPRAPYWRAQLFRR